MAAVDGAIVFGLRSRRLGIDVPNRFIAECVEQNPKRLVGFACVDPNDEEAPRELQEAAAMGLRGLKLAPIYQYFHPHSPEAGRVYRQAVALGIPILWHQGATFTETGPLEFANPVLLERVALEFPEMTQIVAHLGHPWYAETIVLMRKHPKLFSDISALYYRPWQFYNMLVLAQEYGVVDRLLLGSDFPFTTPAETIQALERVNDVVEGTRLPRVLPETVHAILDENAQRAVGNLFEP
jgi:predicted TIM-barrel fold metal-dependent hydrolase